MAITNHERVGKALDLLRAGLGPFVDREVKGALESRRLDAFKLRDYAEDPVLANKPTSEWDVAGLLKLMWETWNDERDVDGPGSLPLRLDGEVPNLGKFAASRRVARAIYLGSAPTADAAQRGIEDRRVRLGCVMPGESPAVFGDALRRLAGAATYLYQDGPRYSGGGAVRRPRSRRAHRHGEQPDTEVHESGIREGVG